MKWLDRYRERRQVRSWYKYRHYLMFLASSGAYIPDSDCVRYDLPEWCAYPFSKYKRDPNSPYGD